LKLKRQLIHPPQEAQNTDRNLLDALRDCPNDGTKDNNNDIGEDQAVSTVKDVPDHYVLTRIQGDPASDLTELMNARMKENLAILGCVKASCKRVAKGVIRSILAN
jgi:hypothetical protein